ncbi:ribokinase [Tetragenococcus halophilus]|uniref:ribokinase n=1 Tax=Tetragenococcus halophilus TaxID=51669 RepID=UPI0030C9154C
MNKVTIVGSINLDTNLRVHRMVKPGETIHGKEHYTAAGGKGANQAVATARAGSKTSFIGAVGNDEPGEQMIDLLKEEKIDVSGVEIIQNEPTGRTFITIDDNGENSIMFYAGANYAFGAEEVAKNSYLIETSDFIIAQLEAPIEATVKAFEIARNKNVKTILNPAPGESNLPEKLLKLTDMIVPNETETETITGVEVTDETSAKNAASKLRELGVEAVIITFGAKGAFYDFNGYNELVPAFKVKAVDTTAAGDTFIGYMVATLEKDFSNLKEAISHGNKASSATVQRFGAQPSIPFKNEMKL